jgi:hypothetical protein
LHEQILEKFSISTFCSLYLPYYKTTIWANIRYKQMQFHLGAVFAPDTNTPSSPYPENSAPETSSFFIKRAIDHGRLLSDRRVTSIQGSSDRHTRMHQPSGWGMDYLALSAL